MAKGVEHCENARMLQEPIPQGFVGSNPTPRTMNFRLVMSLLRQNTDEFRLLKLISKNGAILPVNNHIH
jgi:hypothetical protein